jgi:hypothetical protein
MAGCLVEVSARSIGKSNGLFHRPQHGVSPHAPRQRLASPVGSRQATGPRRRARTGRVAGDGQPALLGLLGGLLQTTLGDCFKSLRQNLLQRCRRCGGAAAETDAHDGTTSISERLVHTRAGVQDAAKARDAAHGQQQGAMGIR